MFIFVFNPLIVFKLDEYASVPAFVTTVEHSFTSNVPQKMCISSFGTYH